MYCNWLNITSLHQYFKSSQMECLDFFPSELTQNWFKNHRHVWKIDGNKLHLAFSTKNSQPEIVPIEDELIFEFYLGINDLYFQQYTDISESPLFYKQFQFELSISKESQFPIPVKLNSGIEIDNDKRILMPPGYQKFGNLKIKISNPYDFFVSCIQHSVNEIVLEAEVKSYFLFYAVKKDYELKTIPNLVEDETQKVTFLMENVDNSDYLFFKSTSKIKLNELNNVEPYSVYVSEEGNRTKLKAKLANFSLRDLGKSPTYPHFPALLKEIKL